ncbi:hypothetical protein [Trinickia sp. Y13]|uniref:type II toxin-antitoxin system RelE/ParE family toxin n=1 Tax=Trinickia sp. Y13 TaxID=2917807 RepID=UPI002406A83F|nr:hypothetical protein [Trinickia sp. Y13]MDG0026140.1 hypothetical protein [Trinickia sp. Y13]
MCIHCSFWSIASLRAKKADCTERWLRFTLREVAQYYFARNNAYELDIPGLRSWPLKRYPHLIFYVTRTDHVDVWRVIDGSRDIPAWLNDEG